MRRLLPILFLACARPSTIAPVRVIHCLESPVPVWYHVQPVPCPSPLMAGAACFTGADSQTLAEDIAALKTWSAEAWTLCGNQK
jgi:hypothetical protein